jgi:hypothetical protein
VDGVYHEERRAVAIENIARLLDDQRNRFVEVRAPVHALQCIQEHQQVRRLVVMHGGR